MSRSRVSATFRVVLAGIFCAMLVLGLKTPVSGSLSLEVVVDPVDGFWRTARGADVLPSGQISGLLEADSEVLWDDRGVPHIFSSTDADAIRTFGYVVAHDRLFQMDFLRRVTAGRLAQVLGPELVPTDRFLRGTGMARAVNQNVRRMKAEGSIDFQSASWFAEGVNAYLSELTQEELPFEFRLLGYRPEPWSAKDAFLVGWNLMFDLTFQREGASAMERVRSSMSPAQFEILFPRASPYSKPIVPSEERHWGEGPGLTETSPGSSALAASLSWVPAEAVARVPAAKGEEPLAMAAYLPPAVEGFMPGKGSNNWAVAGSRSATGSPVLAGDMHLGLSLPAIWYEIHLVTPDMDTYGVSVPGVPLPIEAFNPDLGWAFTNTGADQIDHLRLALNPAGTKYRYEAGWRDLELEVDSIHVLGASVVLDTVKWSHWGPVTVVDGSPIAIKWTALGEVRNFEAVWGMNHARTYSQFETALRKWDAAMQNILVVAPGDTIAIRSTGHLPIRADGTGFGVRDGSSSSSEWIGRVPFEELPHVINPNRGYLTSTNQRPADSTYPYYLGQNWRSIFRSIRIDELLSGSAQHDVNDIVSYQSDVHVVQADLLIPLVGVLGGLTPKAEAFRDALVAWNREAATDLREPVLYSVWSGILHQMAWDEAIFRSRRPTTARLHQLLTQDPGSVWLDRVGTDEVEDASAILVASLEAAADSVAIEGPDWGDVHRLVIRHITGSAALRPLWRGSLPYPGYSQTLSPGSGRTVTHSASWRVILDLQGDTIVGRGIYPGGQSGNPFSSRYDQFVQDYAEFRHYDLKTPSAPEELAADAIASLRIQR